MSLPRSHTTLIPSKTTTKKTQIQYKFIGKIEFKSDLEKKKFPLFLMLHFFEDLPRWAQQETKASWLHTCSAVARPLPAAAALSSRNPPSITKKMNELRNKEKTQNQNFTDQGKKVRKRETKWKKVVNFISDSTGKKNKSKFELSKVGRGGGGRGRDLGRKKRVEGSVEGWKGVNESVSGVSRGWLSPR